MPQSRFQALSFQQTKRPLIERQNVLEYCTCTVSYKPTPGQKLKQNLRAIFPTKQLKRPTFGALHAYVGGKSVSSAASTNRLTCFVSVRCY